MAKSDRHYDDLEREHRSSMTEAQKIADFESLINSGRGKLVLHQALSRGIEVMIPEEKAKCRRYGYSYKGKTSNTRDAEILLDFLGNDRVSTLTIVLNKPNGEARS